MNKFELTTQQNIRIRGCHTGLGTAHLVAFHGFGQSAEVLCAQLSFLNENRNIWCFNLPYHGGDQGFHGKEDYFSCIIDFLKGKGVQQFDVFGFSIGARVAIEMITREGGRLYLLAPDGLARRWLFEWLTQNKAGKTVFRAVTKNDSVALIFSYILKGLNFLMPGIPLQKLWLSNEWRSRLFDRWVALSTFSSERKLTRNIVGRHAEWLLLAAHDVLIDNRKLVKLCKKHKWPYRFVPVHHDVISIQLSSFVSAKSFDLRITSSSAQEANE